jgi:hypothetical protein
MLKLKNILNEGYAWERRADGSLPTLKDVQEAYDAKGVEDAVDEANEEAKPDYIDLDKDGNEEESMKDAAADANKKAEQNPKDGTPKEDLPSKDLAILQMKETEDDSNLDALNMGSLEEGFWSRVKGNLHGHEYILRETFKK